ncbi:MAG: hypothetical protein AAFU03_18610, partial [Bacteroidota bacterium]
MSLVIELLATFSPTERQQFANYLARPDISLRDDVRRLGKLLLSTDTCPSPKQVFTMVAPSRTFSRQHYNQLHSWLYT